MNSAHGAATLRTSYQGHIPGDAEPRSWKGNPKTMAGKRNYSQYPKRLRDELLGPYAGVSAAGATVIAIAQGAGALGWLAAGGIVVAGLTGAGVVVAVAGLAAAAAHAIPPANRDAADHNTTQIPVDELADFDPPVIRLGVIGESMAGKSTLLDHILHTVPRHERTQGVRSYICSLQTQPVRYIALIDGSGEEFSDQFTVALHSDILCVVVDHNASDTQFENDSGRLEQTIEFQRQVRSFLRSSKSKRPSISLIVLANKRDLWQQQTEGKQQEFMMFLDQVVKDWKECNLVSNVELMLHTNNSAEDITKFLRKIG